MDNLADDKLEELREVFDVFKSNEQISVIAFPCALKCLGIVIADFKVDAMFDNADVNNEGSLSFLQFANAVVDELDEEDPEQQLLLSFQALDKEKFGVVDVKEFIDLMTNFGNKMPAKEVREIVRIGDPLKKGIIKYTDLIDKMLE